MWSVLMTCKIFPWIDLHIQSHLPWLPLSELHHSMLQIYCYSYALNSPAFFHAARLENLQQNASSLLMPSVWKAATCLTLRKACIVRSRVLNIRRVRLEPQNGRASFQTDGALRKDSQFIELKWEILLNPALRPLAQVWRAIEQLHPFIQHVDLPRPCHGLNGCWHVCCRYAGRERAHRVSVPY